MSGTKYFSKHFQDRAVPFDNSGLWFGKEKIDIAVGFCARASIESAMK